MERPTRAVALGATDATFTERPDGSLLVRPTAPLAPYPDRLTDRLVHWATVAPDRRFLAQRDAGGDWRALTYAETLARVRAIGAALLTRGLSAERPIAILSGNDIEHALLALAAMHVGIPYAPISPAYSLISQDFSKLRHCLALLTPGLVFAADIGRYGRAIAAAVAPDAEVVTTSGQPEGRRALPFAELTATPGGAVDGAVAAVTPDSVAKILFTSGSTGTPKGVINPQRMLCSNQAMIGASMRFLAEEPPVMVDWLPWNHTFGGNHNVGIALYNGGTLYIDDGKPTPAGMAETVRNLREIAPTVYFNVPKGWEELVVWLRREPALAERFFSRVKLLFYAGAGLAPHVWSELEELAMAACGERIVMLTGLGSTETGPFALCTRADCTASGIVGLPVPGVELKLAPVDGKLEARVISPAVTPGYWRQPELTAQAFDDEGFYRFGDALRFVDPADRGKGFFFDGRINEDFKLTTGTWVSAGPLRARLVAELAPYVRDAVIAGRDRDYVAVLLFADADACRGLCPDLGPAADALQVLRDPRVHRHLRQMLAALADAGTGSSNRVLRALVLEEPPSIDAGEATDKGSINQRAVLDRRQALVEVLYQDPPPPAVIAIERLS